MNVNVQDLAAGSIILEAAGGEIRFMNGQRFHLGDHFGGAPLNKPLIAAPKGYHASFSKHLRQLGS
jgi:myo-inositol-1(or 4)-monophosphatase